MGGLGTDMRFVWVNSALAEMFGRPAADFAGRPVAEVWPAVDAARAEVALQQVLTEGRPAMETFAPCAAGGSAPPGQRIFHWFGVHHPDGTLSGAGLIVIAGTAGPATEEALRRSEERYRALVQGGAQITWVTSPEGEMLEDSAEWRWITGQTVAEFLGNGWLESIHPEDRERVERDWRESLRTGRIFEERFRMRTRGGSYRHYDVRAVPIERDGKIAEWVGACTDVTSQRAAEEMRHRLTAQLSAAALRTAPPPAAPARRTARLQQATAMLAEALDVEQVVEVITEVGRTAIGALRSAVALLEDDKLGLRVVNPSGLAPTGPDRAEVRLSLETPSIFTRAIATRRPVLIADPEELRSQFDNDPDEPGPVLDTGDEQAWVGLPLLAAGMPLGALRFSFGKPRTILEEERVFLAALAGQGALAVERAEM